MTEYNYNKLLISNLRPYDHMVLPVTVIKPNESEHKVDLNYSLIFPIRDYDVIIDRCRVILDTSGINNITYDQSVIVNGFLTNIPTGYYLTQLETPYPYPGSSSVDLVSILNITVPRSGPNSFQATANVSLDLTNSPDLQKILGFTTLIVNPGTISPNKIKETNGFDNLFIYCDLIKQSSPTSSVALIDVPINVPFGQIVTNISSNLQIPIITENNSSFIYKLRKADGTPYSINTEITINTDILVYKRI
ncbi:MAG: hypothetical protein ACRC5W_10700 [Cetobacterium sp.]